MPKLPPNLAKAIAAIVLATIAVEAGYVADRNDPGGATNHGVTEAVARAHGYADDMRQLPVETAIEIYGADYVVKPHFDQLVTRSIALGHKIVDAGVNMGPARPSCFLQTALNALNRQQADYRDVQVDCQIGPATLAAFDALERKRGEPKACELVVKLIDAQQGAEYLRLTAANAKLETFMVGWVDNRIENVPLHRCLEGGVK